MDVDNLKHFDFACFPAGCFCEFGVQPWNILCFFPKEVGECTLIVWQSKHSEYEEFKRHLVHGWTNNIACRSSSSSKMETKEPTRQRTAQQCIAIPPKILSFQDRDIGLPLGSTARFNSRQRNLSQKGGSDTLVVESKEEIGHVERVPSISRRKKKKPTQGHLEVGNFDLITFSETCMYLM